MRVRILKGTNQIGGCITEITSDNGTSIIIDFGEDLPDDNSNKKPENPLIDGLTTGEKKYDAVFITHSHGDHIGLINYILDDIDVYVEPISKCIYNLLAVFTYKNARFKTQDMLFDKEIKVGDKGDIVVTPYRVDHSSYNSAMLLIEVDGKRILHTGDFRSHGLKGNEFEPTLKSIGHVDLIITEGTALSRDDTPNETEESLTLKAIEIFNKYDQVFILQSSTNIDRIQDFYKAAQETGKNFIQDLFTSNVVTSLKDPDVPVPDLSKGVYTWISDKYLKKKSNKFKFRYVWPYWPYRKQKAYRNKKYAMMVKASMLDDIKKLYSSKNGESFITNACLIYSMWEGYKDKEEMKEFFNGIENCGITDIIDLHTSGHADQQTIGLLKNLKADKIIPIHTTNPKRLIEILGENVYLPKENEEIEV